MKNFLYASALVMLLPFCALSQMEYNYSIDLTQVENDMVKVSLTPTALNTNKVVFIMPKVVPGTYSTENFGRFIKRFTAFDANGKRLKVKQVKTNQFYISGAGAPARIEYYVSDTWDDKDTRHFIFPPGGSNVEEGKNFVINPFAFFGYFDGYKMNPIRVEVTKPKNFYGSGHLQKISESSEKDILRAPNYVYLSDNPMMYCIPDTTSFRVANSTVHVSVYSSNGIVKSATIAQYLMPLSEALKKFFVTLPVDDYHFLYYFIDPSNTSRSKAGGLSSGFGALEHNHSSLYFLPETKFEKAVKETVDEVSAHEFLHILTPLNIHSKEIDDFDYLNPKMSKHLWMYEGVTEYFSALSQFQGGLIDEKSFTKNIRTKISEMEEFGNFSMTDMSTNVLDKKNQDLYLSVYNKGAVLAMLLDIRIAELTEGKRTLKSVMMDLAGKYGQDKPFNDEDLFGEIEALSHPGIKEFIEKYIEGKEPLPVEEMFPKIGWNYKKASSKKVYLSGYFGLRFSEKTNELIFDKVGVNQLGVVSGDVLLAINEEPTTISNVSEQFRDYFQQNTSAAEIRVKINRKGQEMVLSTVPKESVLTVKNALEIEEEMEPKVQLLRKAVLGL